LRVESPESKEKAHVVDSVPLVCAGRETSLECAVFETANSK
jgi:hypothetical protein